MNSDDEIQQRLKAWRNTGAATAGTRGWTNDRLWIWRLSGLVLGLVIALAVAVLTLTPMPVVGPSFSGIDKVYHFLAFAALIFPLIVTDSRRWTWAVPLAAAFGGAIELIQPSVGRSAEWLDFGADLSGILAGAALAEILHDRLRARMLDGEPPEPAPPAPAADPVALEAMRAELLAELRAVLREELSQGARDAEVRTQGQTGADALPKTDP